MELQLSCYFLDWLLQHTARCAAAKHCSADALRAVQTVTDNAAKDFTASWKVWGRQWSLQAESRPTAHFKMLPLPRMEYDINYRAEVTFADGDCYILAMVPSALPLIPKQAT